MYCNNTEEMCLKANTNMLDSLRCKKMLAIFPSPAGMKLIKLPADIPAGDGKIANLFFTV